LSTRHDRRAAAARTRGTSRPPAPSWRSPAVVASAAVVVAVLVIGGVWFATSRSVPSPAGPADVTPVALPTFGADAPQNVLDSSAPEILTPTPGTRSGPAAPVVTTGNWQVFVAHSAVPEMGSPSGVAIDGDGNLYVVDFEGDFVQKLSSSGQPVARFGQKGNAPGQFAGPTNLTVDRQGNIYVADTNNQRIQKLSATGQAVAQFGQGGDGPGQFWLPSGVAVDDQGRIYVADRGNHRIQVLSPAGQPLAQWGTRGPSPGQFWAPSDVAVDASGQVYVADSSNQRIQVLSSQGTPVAQWGWEGTDPGTFELPSSLSLDASGNVYVSDSRNNRVQKLSPTGQPLAAWGTVVGPGTPPPAPQPGTFSGPGGLAVDAQGALYVADTRNARIQKLVP
jgi:tripartite motif-containing protein 71